MKQIGIIFPHQLFEQHPLHEQCDEIFIVEEYLFFRQYAFHKQKIAFHRASMKAFAAHLQTNHGNVNYIDSHNELADIRLLLEHLMTNHPDFGLHYIDPTDNWLQQRIEQATRQRVSCTVYENTLFLNSRADLQNFFHVNKKSFFQTTFYKQQRIKRNILLTDTAQPTGGQWTYDIENRKKYPSGKRPPNIKHPAPDTFWLEAKKYVEQHFADNPGEIDNQPLYPINYKDASDWLIKFLEERFVAFGPFEDAIVHKESYLHHSVLSPMLNIGLLKPQHVLEKALQFAKENNVPINSTEGFVRQIIGWREFIRGMYEIKGSVSRTTNFWNFQRKIPTSFYTGNTGILPVDETIKKVLRTGYCHHIERLMVLGNFMLLCQFDPDEVYRWFMELFIDAYDWVMVPNVYGMSQFADGGLFATKPYIGGSNYVKKMSDYPKGDWQEVWDGLFWHFIDTHRDFFTKNPRLSMMVRTFDKMAPEKKAALISVANQYFQKLEE